MLDHVERAAVSRAQSALNVLGLSSRELRGYSLARAIAATVPGPLSATARAAAGLEIEASRALAQKLERDPEMADRLSPAGILVPAEVLQRAMSTNPGGKGGYMVGVENMGFIDTLRARSVAMRLGARVITGLTGNVVAPRGTATVTTSWQAADGTSTSATDQSLGQLSMTPRSLVAITDTTEQLLRQTEGTAEAVISADLANAVAIALDNAVINGTGGAQPLGIRNTPGVTTGQDASSATLAKVLAFLQAAGGANALRGNPAFVTSTAGAIALAQKQKAASTSSFLWEGSVFDGQLVGIPAMSSEQLASGNLIFGSWEEIAIGEWGVLELSTDRGGTRFNQGLVGIRAMWIVDVLVRYPQSFVTSTNLS